MADHDLHAVAFPKIDTVHLAALRACTKASLKSYRTGQKLFESGQRDCNFYVIQSGEVEIVNEFGDAPTTVTIHLAGEFAGDVQQLNGGPALVTAVAKIDCEAYEVSPDGLLLLWPLTMRTSCCTSRAAKR